jgi:hypothetical protein
MRTNYTVIKIYNFDISFSSPNIIRMINSKKMRWAGRVARVGSYKISLRKPEGKRPLGRRRRRLEDNIKMDLLEEGF